MVKSLMRVTGVALASLVMGGCIVSRVAVDKPVLPLPESLATSAGAVPVAERWWSVFADPRLDQLMDEALAHNADVAAAAARVMEARATLRESNSNRSPAVSLEGNAARRFDSVLAGQSPDPGVARDSYSAQAVVSYELDLWGRYARASEAARARLLQSGFDRDAVRLSLTGDVARGYFSLLAARQQLDRARETLVARRESARLEKIRFDAGESDEATLRRTEAEAATAAISAQQFELEAARRSTALGVLLGRSPKEIEAVTFEATALPQAPLLSPGIPSTVLARRPDIRSAEAALSAAAADIGVARTGLFPSISLTGTYGAASRELSDLFTSPAKQWSVAAGLLQPVFQAGRLRSVVDRANARQQQRQAEYARSVQSAFRDVFDALKGQELLGGIRQTTGEQATALARAAELSEVRYAAGEIGYLELLDVRRTLYQSQIALVGAQRDALTNAVDLALALGGGATAP